MPTPSNSSADFPQPSSQAQGMSDQLLTMIHQSIELENGFIPFDKFMDLALYAPGFGYYVAGLAKFGDDGDFVTAPEIGDLFGRCLARQCDQVLAVSGGDIVEFGAGSGALAAQLLNNVQILPDRYTIVETSPDLIERQRATLMASAPDKFSCVNWVRELPEQITGVVVANEVLDAMPVSRFVVDDGAFHELGVGAENGQLVNRLRVDGPAATELKRRFDPLNLASGYRSEFCLRAEAWVATIGTILKRGVLLTIDYGFSASEYYSPARATGTLRCHYRHRAHDDPLLWPGLQDITAHVDFSATASAGMASGLDLGGYTSFANFLMNLGLIDFIASGGAEAGSETTSEMDRYQLNRQITRLTSPLAMGEVFKVLALTRDFNEPIRGFSQRDQRHQLFQANS